MNCNYCGKPLNKTTGEINRAKKAGLSLYCNRECSGLGRRNDKTKEQKKLEKQQYDKEYRNKNKERIKAKKAEYNKTKAGRATQKRDRDKRKEQHLEYCRQPEYRAYKKEYDQKHRAKKQYGEFWESAILLNKIEQQIPNREVKQQKGLINKSQKRKRNYEKTKCKEFERGTLGNIERS